MTEIHDQSDTEKHNGIAKELERCEKEMIVENYRRITWGQQQAFIVLLQIPSHEVHKYFQLPFVGIDSFGIPAVFLPR